MQVPLPYEQPLFPLVDIGVNLTDRAFAEDVDTVLQRAMQAGLTGLLLTGTNGLVSETSLKLAESHPALLRATAGVHPHHASEWSASLAADIRGLLQHPLCVAVGETGLDFNRNFSTPTEQETAFEAQLGLAVESGKPLFIHERDAGQRMLEILRHWRDDLSGAVVHCFTGDKTSLFGYLDLDLYIGLTGWVCDERRGTHLWPLVSSIPEQRLLIESDAPWLLPRNLRPKPKKGRNEPAFLPWVLVQLAQLRSVEPLQLAQQTSQNACKLFHLPDDLLEIKTP
ncbi:TatD family hydrolase [Marinospirillum alkaliphilum]|uniref:TatD DNase family protein n=1 Tax=Marinospirillum alkaliphilum DSM 21637 TaxID=1122209 RepID=A0A1K1TCF1_9GAMM|nr:TatD family hydrolase [Marinospirillum alkaliphilum]SFW98224.1 TatD DNase family protein [Marinospirillum alkaliphilum DSM 21637]